MKKLFLLTATVFTLAAFQSCSKCGHCVYTTTYPSIIGSGTTTDTDHGSTYCGNGANESGSYLKQAEKNCERWAAEQPERTDYTYASSWEADK